MVLLLVLLEVECLYILRWGLFLELPESVVSIHVHSTPERGLRLVLPDVTDCLEFCKSFDRFRVSKVVLIVILVLTDHFVKFPGHSHQDAVRVVDWVEVNGYLEMLVWVFLYRERNLLVEVDWIYPRLDVIPAHEIRVAHATEVRVHHLQFTLNNWLILLWKASYLHGSSLLRLLIKRLQGVPRWVLRLWKTLLLLLPEVRERVVKF